MMKRKKRWQLLDGETGPGPCWKLGWWNRAAATKANAVGLGFGHERRAGAALRPWGCDFSGFSARDSHEKCNADANDHAERIIGLNEVAPFKSWFAELLDWNAKWGRPSE